MRHHIRLDDWQPTHRVSGQRRDESGFVKSVSWVTSTPSTLIAHLHDCGYEAISVETLSYTNFTRLK